MDNIKVNALMLRATDYLENDKILTLLTAEKGKITAGIKGVKKAGAKLKFAAQPFCFAEYILAERGGRYTVTQASECESFYDLRTDVNKFYAACAACETAAALTFEGDGGCGVFYGCVKALTQMCGGDEARANKLSSHLFKGRGVRNFYGRVRGLLGRFKRRGKNALRYGRGRFLLLGVRQRRGRKRRYIYGNQGGGRVRRQRGGGGQKTRFETA